MVQFPAEVVFFSFPKHSDWLWGSSSLLCWWVLEPLSIGVKQLEHEVDHSLPSNAKVKNESSDISTHIHTHTHTHTHTHSHVCFHTLCTKRIEVLKVYGIWHWGFGLYYWFVNTIALLKACMAYNMAGIPICKFSIKLWAIFQFCMVLTLLSFTALC